MKFEKEKEKEEVVKSVIDYKKIFERARLGTVRKFEKEKIQKVYELLKKNIERIKRE